jgi:OOP family OmpA-OmpF porin
MKNILITLMALSAGLVNAQTVDNWVNASGTPWKNSTGQCWRNSSWTPATAHQDCDGALKPPVVASVTKPSQVDITKPTATIAQAASTPPAITKTTYQADTLFDFDKSILKPEGKVSLEVIIVVGHTDSVGTDGYNMKLGDRRAQTVKAYLVSKGIERNRVYTESKGEKQPVADNKTKEGRAKNRRVEIEVVGTTK